MIPKIESREWSKRRIESSLVRLARKRVKERWREGRAGGGREETKVRCDAPGKYGEGKARRERIAG